MEDVKVREMQIFDYKKKIAEAETKLKQQQNLYEAVRSDRNLYSKNLIESQDEITEMKRKLKIMNHQIDQLKEEITGKEAALVKEHLDHQRWDDICVRFGWGRERCFYPTGLKSHVGIWFTIGRDAEDHVCITRLTTSKGDHAKD